VQYQLSASVRAAFVLLILAAASGTEALAVEPPVAPAAPAVPAADAVAPAAAAASEPPPAAGASDRERLQVTDPYIELHTGPGRGYPIFYVVERKGWVEIESRHTDWYKVHADNGKVGWVDRRQLESTLTESGGQKSFRDIVLEDYLHRRVEAGASWGHFSGSPMLKLWAAYNLNDMVAVELSGGQVQGLYSGTTFWGVDIIAEPWADRRLAPFFGIGLGKIDNAPNASLVSALSNSAKMANATVGLRYHVTDRLVARVDWTEYTAFISSGRTDQYHALAAGLAFFF